VARTTLGGQNHHVEIAFFDLDKTIVARSSPLALGRSFMREGLISRSWLLKSLYAQLMFHLMGADEQKMQKLQKEAAKLTEGWDAAKVREVVEEVLEEVMSPLMYAEALELIHDHRAAGRLVCIVSSSPTEIVEPLAELLSVDRFIASRPTIKDGKYTGGLSFYAYGKNKVQAMRDLAAKEETDLAHCFAYSDSITDLPMLEAVGHPVAINPDKELRKIVVQRGWPTESFRNPVSLRGRLTDLDIRARVADLRLRERVPVLELSDMVPDWDVHARFARRRLDELGLNRLATVQAAGVAMGVAGVVVAVWWAARKSRTNT
jgi:HAD superfamily hydrolase (TIGR01490 family)